MAVAGEDLLKLNIKNQSFSPLYMFYGEDDYMKHYYLNKIKQKAVGDNFPEFNIHELDGAKAGIEEIIELCSIVPMMHDYALIIVSDFDFTSVSEEKLQAFLDGLCEGNIVVLYYRCLKPNFQRANWKKLKAAAGDRGLCIDFKKKDVRELAKIVISAAGKRKCYIPQYLAAKFVEMVGDDLSLIVNEVDKLCSMKGEGEITESDIAAITVKTLDASVFDLTKELIKSNTQKVFEILRELFEQQQRPESILGAIDSSYIDMYRVKVASEKGLDPKVVANFYAYSSDWRLTRAAYNAKNLSISQLRRSLNVLCEADMLIKGVNSDSAVVLDETIVKLLLIVAKG